MMTLFAPSWAHALGWTLLHTCWQASLVALIWWIFRSLLQQASPKVRYMLAISALGSIVVWAGLTFYNQLPDFFVIQSADNEGVVFGMDSSFSLVPSVADTKVAEIPWSFQAIAHQLTPWLSSIWLIGVLIMLIRFIKGLYRLQFLRKNGLVAMSEEWNERVQKLTAKMGLHAVQVAFSKHVKQPVSFGFFKPLVLLPASILSGLSPEQIEVIIMHELAHIKRADYLVNLFQSLVEILFFYHPAIWWISREIRNERELCCDDMVLSYSANTITYAEALTKLHLFKYRPSTKAALYAKGGDFTSRIQRLFSPHAKHNYWRAGIAALMLIVGVLLGSYYLYQRSLNSWNKQEVASANIKTFYFNTENWRKETTNLFHYFRKTDFEAHVEEVYEKDVLLDFYIIYKDRTSDVYQRIGIKSPASFEVIIDSIEQSIQLRPTYLGTYYHEDKVEEVILRGIKFGEKEELFDWAADALQKENGLQISHPEFDSINELMSVKFQYNESTNGKYSSAIGVKKGKIGLAYDKHPRRQKKVKIIHPKLASGMATTFLLSPNTSPAEFKAMQAKLPLIGLGKPAALFNKEGKLAAFYSLHQNENRNYYLKGFRDFDQLQIELKENEIGRADVAYKNQGGAIFDTDLIQPIVFQNFSFFTENATLGERVKELKKHGVPVINSGYTWSKLRQRGECYLNIANLDRIFIAEGEKLVALFNKYGEFLYAFVSKPATITAYNSNGEVVKIPISGSPASSGR